MKTFYLYMKAIVQNFNLVSIISRRLHRSIEPIEIFEAGLGIIGCDFLGEFRQCIEYSPCDLDFNDRYSKESGIVEQS